jgi:benzoate/toluate 1,2-dioxygenase beta subunit
MAGKTIPRGDNPDLRAIEQFLYREASYLDRKLYQEWLDLFTEDGLYWVPAAPDQKDPDNHVSLFFEDRILRQMRVRRLLHPKAYSLESPVRSSRMVGNVLLEDYDAATGDCRVRSTFHMLELQFGEQHFYGGFYIHDLASVEDGYKIKMKRVDLINCDGPLDIMQSFL